MRLHREFTVLYLFLIAIVQAAMAVAAQAPYTNGSGTVNQAATTTNTMPASIGTTTDTDVTTVDPIDPMRDSTTQTPGSDATTRSSRAMQNASGTPTTAPRY
jgi:hypothetical protein